MFMSSTKTRRHDGAGDSRLLTTLADFRYQLRRFLAYSERASAHAGLHPQQHQLLLQVAGKREGTLMTIACAAERLGLQHHSAVELVDRSVGEGLLARTHDSGDRRRVILSLTRKGRRTLESLSKDHALELQEMGPQLVRSLRQIALLKPGRMEGAGMVTAKRSRPQKSEFPSGLRAANTKETSTKETSTKAGVASRTTERKTR